MSPSRLVSIFCVIVALSIAPTLARGQGFIRDTEIEAALRAYAEPVFDAAGLDSRAVRIYLVADDSLNAFVAGGQRLFINTGLLKKASSPEQVIGVIAHEAGHIAGGHLSRTRDALRTASAQSILAAILGAAAGIATGRGDLGSAIIAGGQQAGTRGFLAYSRAQESAADQAALRFLDRAGISAEGLLEFMRKLEDQELLSAARQSPYVRSHPIARDRVAFVEQFVRSAAATGRRVDARLIDAHARLRAKLIAFTGTLTRTLRRYPPSDTSLPARYARAIAYYRTGRLAEALPLIDGLIAEEPDNPYFHELKGQMLFENGQAEPALAPLERAVALAPSAPLLRGLLAHVQVETGRAELLGAAQSNLLAALAVEAGNAGYWRQLAIVYGHSNQPGMAALAQAENALLRGDRRAARYHAEQADRQLPDGTPARQRIEDIRRATDAGEDRPGAPQR